MKKMSAQQQLEELAIEQILSMTEEEIAEDMEAEGYCYKDELKKFQLVAKQSSLQFRKRRLEKAKQGLKSEIAQESQFSALDWIKKKGLDAHDALIELMKSGQVPNDMTIAFREGKEVTEEEALSIIEDLVELGVVTDDERKDKK
ncbi:hypothetical protein GCM10011369_19070 [Neiella marina]|uniref:Uncharacterized protein n=1 Tax=Neiella marina TaxID=508461 RepID=A0A8J2U4X6_9GAMM|nr:hypothetical protein [Neiella marina]GGA77377.1 hypothetical protein GCM10011369_19070 [Neiella marina]